MKKVIFLFVSILFLKCSYAQVGKQFPATTGETLEDVKITIPDDTKGKYTFIGMAYSKKADEPLATWYQPIYDKFIAKEGMAGLFTSVYDIHVYFIPMFTGAKRAAAEPVRKDAKEQLDTILHPYVLFYKGELKKYKNALGIKRKDTPYFFLLDKNGVIIYSTYGRCNEKKMDEIDDLISD